jgi:hypothetical protein
MSVKNEATPIARLIDGCTRTLGWVYLWDTTDLSILWRTGEYDAASIVWLQGWQLQSLSVSATNDPILDLLASLSTIEDET